MLQLRLDVPLNNLFQKLPHIPLRLPSAFCPYTTIYKKKFTSKSSQSSDATVIQ